MKKSVKIIILLLLLPLILDISVMLVNDIIANKPENELLGFELPGKTHLVESNSVAGKLYGNGNGMQYIGQLLVATELSEEELREYYSGFDGVGVEIQVKKQNSPIIYEYFPKQEFKNFDSNENNYMIELVRFNPGTNAFWNLLDWDIRGH